MTEPPTNRETPGAGRLLVRVGGKLVDIMPLSKALHTIGREPGNDIVLPDRSVSRRHAEIRMESLGPVLTDLGSSNGTFVGSSRLPPNQPRRMRHGDSYRIGAFTLTYDADVPADEDQPPELEVQPEATDLAAAVSATRIVPVDGHSPPTPARPTSPEPLAPGSTSIYLANLPGIFHEGDFLGRYLLIFESIWEPLEKRQDHIALYFDPLTSPKSFLPWMASWFDLPHHAHWPEGRVRDRLAQADDLYRWRGTPYGLARMIEVTTGFTPAITEAADEPFVFHIRVPVPPGAEVERGVIEDLIETHKPAHAGYVLEIGP